MTTSQITATLTKWNSRQDLRQRLVNSNRETLRSALERSKSDDLKNTQVWSSVMLFKH